MKAALTSETGSERSLGRPMAPMPRLYLGRRSGAKLLMTGAEARDSCNCSGGRIVRRKAGCW